ncbi:hypothetical protein [Arthrobacter sp. B0490]|nr:hypothetical protein [Arthrobacter sp. B0490]
MRTTTPATSTMTAASADVGRGSRPGGTGAGTRGHAGTPGWFG